MQKNADLFEKTFDQHVNYSDGDIQECDVSPNRRIPADIVFEQFGSRIQATAYDADNRIIFKGDAKKTEEGIVSERVKGEVILEPMGLGVRVTARDENHKVLRGYIGSKETTKRVHCSVAIYETLQKLVKEELEKRGRLKLEEVDPIDLATEALDSLSETLKWLRNGMDVKKVSDATLERARVIARVASDANRQITLDVSSMKGMKSKTNSDEIRGSK